MGRKSSNTDNSNKPIKGVTSGETRGRTKLIFKFAGIKGLSNWPRVGVASESHLIAVTNLTGSASFEEMPTTKFHRRIVRAAAAKQAQSTNAQQRFEKMQIKVEELISEKLSQSAEFREALEELEREALHYGDIDQEEKNACIGALAEIPEMPESRLVMLDRIAKNRNALAQDCDLLEAKEFGSLLQGMIKPGNKNIARDVRKLKEAGKIIGLEWHGKTLYPSIQINPHDLSTYPEIRSLLQSAMNKGCDEWDVLQWLMTDYEIPLNKEVAVGKPSGAKSLKDIAKNLHEKTHKEVARAKPLELLESGKSMEFNKLQTAWLGE